MSKPECLMIYIDYVESQIEAGLMPSKFITWFEHECENYTTWRKYNFNDADLTRKIIEA